MRCDSSARSSRRTGGIGEESVAWVIGAKGESELDDCDVVTYRAVVDCDF